jgi:hypothetical protein
MTFEITKDDHLTQRGDCIVAVRASKSISELSDEFKRLARSALARISVELEADGIRETAAGMGHPGLSFSHASDIVARKSAYVSERTLMIRADKAAGDFSRALIKRLQNERVRLEAVFTVEL